MRHEPTSYLFDILQAIDLVQVFVEGKSFEDYLDDLILRSAVERQLAVVPTKVVDRERSDLLICG